MLNSSRLYLNKKSNTVCDKLPAASCILHYEGRNVKFNQFIFKKTLRHQQSGTNRNKTGSLHGKQTARCHQTAQRPLHFNVVYKSSQAE